MSKYLKIFLTLISLPFLLIFIGFIVVAIGAITRPSDEKILKSYKATPEIADIAEKDTLTDKGKAIFYRAEPKFVDSETFIKVCQTVIRGVEALACIAPKPNPGLFDGRQIFLLQIDDPKFIDHKYAAAVHEMLHAAYKSLGSKEKTRLNQLLNQELLKQQNDSHLATIIELVKTKTSSGIEDELHSKFGVEYKDLSPELETYYQKYFTDRKRVVDLYQKGGFNSRVKKLDQLNQELATLNTKITGLNNQMNNDLVGQYNILVNQYNAKVAESKKIFSEIEQFYRYFNPDYKPAEAKKS